MATPESPPWPTWKIAVWAVLALVVSGVFGPRFVDMFRPPDDAIFDFSQEWLSARNYYTGTPVYSPQADAVKRHMDPLPPNTDNLLPWNAHPPASILLALPLGQVADYNTAHYYWNLATFPLFLLGLLIVLRALDVPIRWYSAFPAIVLTLVSAPVFLNLGQGQINFVLFPLMAAAWWADRRDYQLLAGLALGLAAGLKLFPGFLFIYFLFAGRWRALVTGLLTVGIVNGAAWIVFGTEAFTTYVRQVMPSLLDFQSTWRNVSLNGFWQRIYNPHPDDKIIAFKENPQLAQGLALGSQLLIAAVTALVALRAKTPVTRDRAFAVGVFGMLLASPIAWTHYFVLLAVPVGILWIRLQRSWLRWVFWLLIIPLWLPENFFGLLAVGPEQARLMINRRHAPINAMANLVALSAFTYDLLALFALATLIRDQAPEPVPPPRTEPDSDLPLDVQRVERRLFGHIGDD